MIKEFAIIRGLAKVCQYVYCKGVADAASFGDRQTVIEMAEREDSYTTMKFLKEDFGIEQSFLSYRDYLAVFASRIGAHHFRNFLIYEIGQVSMKNNMCTLVDYLYRIGLKDGVNYSRNEGMAFFDKQKEKKTYSKPDGTTTDEVSFIQEIKYYANKIHNTRRRIEIPSTMNRLSLFIGDAVMLQKIEEDDS